jgi:hypothetical protein
MKTVVKILFATFLVFCIAVHVYGLIRPFSRETPLSHSLHILSYALCLFAFLWNSKYSLPLYCLGALYPVLYHARCAWNSYSDSQTINYICILVVILLPLMAWFVAKQNRPAL